MTESVNQPVWQVRHVVALGVLLLLGFAACSLASHRLAEQIGRKVFAEAGAFALAGTMTCVGYVLALRLVAAAQAGGLPRLVQIGGRLAVFGTVDTVLASENSSSAAGSATRFYPLQVARGEDGSVSGVRCAADLIASVSDLARSGAIDTILLSLDEDLFPHRDQLETQFHSLPVRLALHLKSSEPPLEAKPSRRLREFPVTILSERPIRPAYVWMKTLIDRAAAVLLLILLSPLMILIALAVGLTSEGPILYWQKRKGWCGRDFFIVKFRTMKHVRGDVRDLRQTSRNDSRCTPVGRFLRKLSLDELPQLWNVAAGEMSLVGPRPHAESLLDFEQNGQALVHEYAKRHRVKPGITGWAQVNGLRGATRTADELRRRVELDIYYIENWSFLLDAKILLRTFFCLWGENAY